MFQHEGFWMGMDTFRDWTELNGLWDSRQPAVEGLGGLNPSIAKTNEAS